MISWNEEEAKCGKSDSSRREETIITTFDRLWFVNELTILQADALQTSALSVES